MKEKILNLNITREFLTTIGGQNAHAIVKTCLEKNKELTDEEISKKVPLKITEIRTILNQLHYRGIACYNKAKTKRSGWYNYTWAIKTKRIAELLLEQKAEEIGKMEKKQELEKTYDQFVCNNHCTQMAFEIAAEYQFKCPECGKQMNLINSKKTARESKQTIESIKREMKLLKKAL